MSVCLCYYTAHPNQSVMGIHPYIHAYIQMWTDCAAPYQPCAKVLSNYPYTEYNYMLASLLHLIWAGLNHLTKQKEAHFISTFSRCNIICLNVRLASLSGSLLINWHMATRVRRNTNQHTCNAVLLVWGSLRLTPIKCTCVACQFKAHWGNCRHMEALFVCLNILCLYTLNTVYKLHAWWRNLQLCSKRTCALHQTLSSIVQ